VPRRFESSFYFCPSFSSGNDKYRHRFARPDSENHFHGPASAIKSRWRSKPYSITRERLSPKRPSTLAKEGDLQAVKASKPKVGFYVGVLSPSFPLRLLPRFRANKARSVFRIGRVSLSLFLPGKVSDGKPVPLDRPPTFRRPMPARPGLNRHHLIGFVGIVVVHFPSAFSPTATRLKERIIT
jgi:hypothetical protein